MSDEERVQRLIIPESAAGARLDTALYKVLEELAAEEPELAQWMEEQAVSRSKLGRWIAEGLVCAEGGQALKPGMRIKGQLALALVLVEEAGPELEPDPTIKLDIAFEDEALLVINKPAGLVVHPGAGNFHGTLVHGLLAYLKQPVIAGGDAQRPGLVHRLDKDTSGLMVVAKTPASYRKLVSQFADRSIARSYLALTLREPRGAETIDSPIGRDPRNRVRMACDVPGAREARTRWRVERRLKSGVMLTVELDTGRTHQIRVHLRARGAPIVGDPLYGLPAEIPSRLKGRVAAFGRQALHAFKLSFLHPLSGARREFDAAPPRDMLDLIEAFDGGA